MPRPARGWLDRPSLARGRWWGGDGGLGGDGGREHPATVPEWASCWHFRAEHRVETIEIRPAEAFASCCGVNLAGGKRKVVATKQPRCRRSSAAMLAVERGHAGSRSRPCWHQSRPCWRSSAARGERERGVSAGNILSGASVPEWGCCWYVGLEHQVEMIEVRATKAFASCCGVNLAGGWRRGVAARAAAISVDRGHAVGRLAATVVPDAWPYRSGSWPLSVVGGHLGPDAWPLSVFAAMLSVDWRPRSFRMRGHIGLDHGHSRCSRPCCQSIGGRLGPDAWPYRSGSWPLSVVGGHLGPDAWPYRSGSWPRSVVGPSRSIAATLSVLIMRPSRSGCVAISVWIMRGRCECTGTSVTTPSRCQRSGLKLLHLSLALFLYIYARRRGRGNVVIPKGFPKSVGRMGRRNYGFPCFPHSVIPMACFEGVERTSGQRSALRVGNKLSK